RGAGWGRLGPGEAVAAAAPGAHLDDLEIEPVFAEEWFALVADLRTATGSRPACWLSRDAARYDGSPRPLAFSAPTPPRRLRVYARGEAYWLVASLRRHGNEECLCWGRIDWGEEPLSIQELTTRSELIDAFNMSGLR